MKKKYTKKQITEAIAYWEKQLNNMNEATYPEEVVYSTFKDSSDFKGKYKIYVASDKELVQMNDQEELYQYLTNDLGVMDELDADDYFYIRKEIHQKGICHLDSSKGTIYFYKNMH